MTTVTDEQVEPTAPDEKPARPSRWQSILQFEITAKKVPLRELQQFSRQMAVFIKAGVPLIDALSMIRDETGSRKFREVLDDILESLRGGGTPAAPAAKHDDAFPASSLGIWRAAELPGDLDTVLLQLSDYIERALDARHKIIGALIYP